MWTRSTSRSRCRSARRCGSVAAQEVLLRIVAKHADVWNYNGSMADFDEALEALKGHCKDVGRDIDEIRITVMAGGICYDSKDELDGFFARIAPQRLRERAAARLHFV